MNSQYKCPVCGVVITAEVEESGYARYDSEQISDALCFAIGDHMIAVHPDKDKTLDDGWDQNRPIDLTNIKSSEI